MKAIQPRWEAWATLCINYPAWAVTRELPTTRLSLHHLSLGPRHSLCGPVQKWLVISLPGSFLYNGFNPWKANKTYLKQNSKHKWSLLTTLSWKHPLKINLNFLQGKKSPKHQAPDHSYNLISHVACLLFLFHTHTHTSSLLVPTSWTTHTKVAAQNAFLVPDPHLAPPSMSLQQGPPLLLADSGRLLSTLQVLSIQLCQWKLIFPFNDTFLYLWVNSTVTYGVE